MKKIISIIGGGSSALALASFLDPQKFEVTVYEKNKTSARKFLVAGDGGFNLTHGSSIHSMLEQYEPKGFLDQALLEFSNEDFRNWLQQIGIETYTGSSGRVFPVKPIKPIEVLQAILKTLKSRGVKFKTNMKWTGWNSDSTLQMNGNSSIQSDTTVFALGGSSWKVTGSDGEWVSLFEEKQVRCHVFEASNCAFELNWPDEFKKNHAGKALKNISLSCGLKTSKGELTVGAFGLEGNAIYALSTEIKQEIKTKGHARISIDFKPMLAREDLFLKLEKSKARNTNEKLKNDIHLSVTAIQMIKNCLSKEDYLKPEILAHSIKQLPLNVLSAAPIDEAISTTGGIALDAIDENFQLNQLQNHYCIGEMLDWNAPTGGYLLQGCFSMGVKLARHLNKI